MNRTRRRIPLRVLLPGLLLLALLCTGGPAQPPLVLVLSSGVARVLFALLWFVLRARR